MYIDETIKKYADQLSANLAKSINETFKMYYSTGCWDKSHEAEFHNDGRKYCVQCKMVQL